MSKEVALTFGSSGAMTFVYEDAESVLGADVSLVLSLGAFTTKRASHVEPELHGTWTADMRPMDGPILGPFTLRREALKAEREWLRTERGL